jgi:hypothetical protein
MERALAAAERDAHGVTGTQLTRLRAAMRETRNVLSSAAGTTSDAPHEPAPDAMGRTPFLFQGQLSGDQPFAGAAAAAAQLAMLQSPMAQEVLQQLNRRVAQHGAPAGKVEGEGCLLATLQRVRLGGACW